MLMSLVGAISAEDFFDTQAVGLGFTEEAEWDMESATILPVSVKDCWDIITSDEAMDIWCPEFGNVENSGEPGVGNIRNAVLDDSVLNILSLGSVGIEQTFDVWNDEEDNIRSYAYYVSGTTRPGFMSWKAAREQFVCEEIDDDNTMLTRTLAIEPGFLTETLEFVVQPRLESIVEEKCPERLLNAIAQGKLPIPEKKDGDKDRAGTPVN